MEKQIWLVKFPTYQYAEDVKALAAQHRLRIVDVKFKSELDPRKIAADVPKLTVKPKKKEKADK